eukprot:m.54656 g.54656  ORF g.54656 m.54656 type:complete len:253 (+) comp11438_c0_seq1:533-1291(+)
MAGFESNNELMKRRLASMLAAPVPVFPEVSSVDEGLRRALQLHMKTAIKHYGVNVVCFPASVYIFDRYAALTGEACEWSELHARKVGVLALQLATKQLHHECFPMEGLCELFQLDAFTEDDLQDLSTAVLSEFILKHPILPPCPYDICRLFVGRLNIPEGASWVENHAMVAVDRALSGMVPQTCFWTSQLEHSNQTLKLLVASWCADPLGSGSNMQSVGVCLNLSRVVEKCIIRVMFLSCHVLHPCHAPCAS